LLDGGRGAVGHGGRTSLPAIDKLQVVDLVVMDPS